MWRNKSSRVGKNILTLLFYFGKVLTRNVYLYTIIQNWNKEKRMTMENRKVFMNIIIC